MNWRGVESYQYGHWRVSQLDSERTSQRALDVLRLSRLSRARKANANRMRYSYMRALLFCLDCTSSNEAVLLESLVSSVMAWPSQATYQLER